MRYYGIEPFNLWSNEMKSCNSGMKKTMKKDMAKDMKGMSKKAGNGYMQAPAKKPAKKSK